MFSVYKGEWTAFLVTGELAWGRYLNVPNTWFFLAGLSFSVLRSPGMGM